MKKFALVIVLVLSCSGLWAGQENGDNSGKPETTINPWLAFAIAWTFDAADLESFTKGFISMGPAGILSIEKSYEKDGVEVRLVGMAHVAAKGFYQDIKDSLTGKPALILMEGVTDDKKRLTSPPDLGSLAKRLGVDDQRKKFSPQEMPDKVEIVRADVDAAEFSEETVEILNLVGQIYSREGFNAGKLIAMYLKLENLDVSQTLFQDLLAKRNACLIRHLQENFGKFHLILVPWGALHLPEIEKWVIGQGFILKGQKSRVILRFPSYFQYLLAGKATAQR